MIEKDIIPTDDNKRIEEILKLSWRILKTRFIKGRYVISREAPFQHYFAHIISTIGDTFCTKRGEIFMVDLEEKLEGKNNNDEVTKNYIDITCGFSSGGKEPKKKTAIELKFKTEEQGAQNLVKINVFRDIKRLENAKKNEKSFVNGRFYMITDYKVYVNESKTGVGTVFTTHDGAETQANKLLHYPDLKSIEDVKFSLDSSYTFNWEKIVSDKMGDWYFLELKV